MIVKPENKGKTRKNKKNRKSKFEIGIIERGRHPNIPMHSTVKDGDSMNADTLMLPLIHTVGNNS